MESVSLMCCGTSRVQKIGTTVLALCLFLQRCFSLSSCVKPEICSLNRVRTSTHCEQLYMNKVPTQGEVFTHKDTPKETHTPYHLSLYVSFTWWSHVYFHHSLKRLTFPIWYVAFLLIHFSYSNSIYEYTEGHNFHNCSCWPGKPVHVGM